MALWQLEGSLDETKAIKKTRITHFPFTIGRNKCLDMVVLHSGISREHAEIYKKGNRLYIRDLDSTNGTFVNKQRISSDMLITHNTLIHFAHVVFKLTDLDYKSQADQHLTRIINIANAPKRKDEAHKNLKVSKSLDSVSDKIVYKKKETKSEDAVKIATIDKTPTPAPASALAPESAPESAPVSAPATTRKVSSGVHKVPRYLVNEKIFVQGGAVDANRRLHIRREAHWPAQVTLKNQEIVQCMTKDFGEKGLALKSPTNLQVNDLVRVEIKAFHKGRNQKITFIGVVKHSLITAGGFLIGIYIKHCAKDCSEFIYDFSNYNI